jgi:hypothetical protein
MACGAEATIGGHQIGLEAAIMKILWLSFYGSKFLWHNQFFQFLAPQEVKWEHLHGGSWFGLLLWIAGDAS